MYEAKLAIKYTYKLFLKKNIIKKIQFILIILTVLRRHNPFYIILVAHEIFEKIVETNSNASYLRKMIRFSDFSKFLCEVDFLW